jgi:hypothetical protein
LCIIIYICEFVRSFFNYPFLPWQVNLFLLYIEQVSQFVVFVLICYFFIHAAGRLVGKARVQAWEKRLKIYLYVNAGILFSFGLILFTPLLNQVFKKKQEDIAGCKRNEFWL